MKLAVTNQNYSWTRPFRGAIDSNYFFTPRIMKSYRVCWSIDVEAENPEQAAGKALEIQRDPESTATVFEIYGPDCPIDGLEIDLEEVDEQDRLDQENGEQP